VASWRRRSSRGGSAWRLVRGGVSARLGQSISSANIGGIMAAQLGAAAA